MLGDVHRAEDLAQEAFARVFVHRKNYQPSGRFSTYLWRIDATGNTKALGPLPTGKWVRMTLPEPAEALFSQAVELAVTVEKLGDTPLAPQLPFVYRGLCGKLWK